jgi:purine catabolism regulator
MSIADASEAAILHTTIAALQAQNSVLRQLVSIHDRLGVLVLQGADVTAITRRLSDLIGRRVLLLDALLQVVAMAPESEHFSWTPRRGYVRAVLSTLARERRPLRVPPMVDFGVEASCVLAPVAVGDTILGYLAILAEGEESTSTDDLDLQIVQHAANVYALSMMRERMAAEVARQLKDELFDDLLLGRTQDEQIARERAMRLGYQPGVTYRVLVVVARAVSEEKRPEAVAQRRRLLESLAGLCARRSPEALASVREEELVVVVPDADGPPEVGRSAVQEAAALLPDWRVTVGVSGACTSASAIARSYAQARRALETAQRFGNQGEVVAFDDLGVYRLLFHVGDVSELQGFTDQVLGALIEYDRRHNADLVRTLAAFLQHNGNLQATARDLNLHVNSVAYRMQRVAAIAQMDLEQSEDRLQAQIALKILNGVGSAGLILS